MAAKEPTENKLRRQIAETEATLETLREKLAKLEASKKGVKPPATGLDRLWEITPERSRNRSTKHKCRVAFQRIPKSEQAPISVLLEAMKAWCQCDDWMKDGGIFIPALDRWITSRAWESPPQIRKANSRHHALPVRPIAAPTPGETVTDKAEIAKLLSLKTNPNTP